MKAGAERPDASTRQQGVTWPHTITIRPFEATSVLHSLWRNPHSDF